MKQTNKEVYKLLVKFSMLQLSSIEILDQVSTINALLEEGVLEDILKDEGIQDANVEIIKNRLKELKELYTEVFMETKLN